MLIRILRLWVLAFIRLNTPLVPPPPHCVQNAAIPFTEDSSNVNLLTIIFIIITAMAERFSQSTRRSFGCESNGADGVLRGHKYAHTHAHTNCVK